MSEFARWVLAAQGAYAFFDPARSPREALGESGRGDFTPLEATRLLGIPSNPNDPLEPGFELRHHQPNDLSGFSASVFFDRSTNRYVLGIRGTEDAADLAEDILRIGVQGFAGGQAVSLYRYYRQLTTPTGQQVNYSAEEIRLLTSMRLGLPATISLAPLAEIPFKSLLSRDVGLAPFVGSGATVIPPGAPLIVTGHSLGGHLALLFGRLFPEVTDHVYTYNAPGISPIGELGLWGLGVRPIDASHVTNLAAVMGSEVISNIPSKPGENIGVATEPGSLVHQHSIVPLTDTLALYGAFGTLSPGNSLDSSAVSGIISAASSFPEDSLEVVLDQLGALLDTGSAPVLIARTGSDLVERDDYYQKLYKVLDSREPGRDYQIESLVGKTVIQIASLAAADISVRYALTGLMPFHARNADYDSLEGKVFSGAWIASRAEMLEGMLKNNLIDRPYGVTGTEDSIVYQDVDSGASFSLLDNFQYQVALPMTSAPAERQRLLDYLDGAAYRRSVVFGSNSAVEGDVLVGMPGGDRLFGGAGDDNLDGKSGGDYLDGGAGQDVLHGGDGDDILDGNEGSDRLEGEAGNDAYVFGPELDADTIVDRDGAIFAGTTQLSGGFGEVGGPFLSGDRKFSYEFSGDPGDPESEGTLVINGTLRVEGFHDGDLGIRLIDGPDPSAWEETTEAELLGDFEYVPIPLDSGGFLYLDEFGNPLPETRAAAVPGGEDSWAEFPGTPGNTHFSMGGGDDQLQDVYGGDDHLELGTGDDAGFGGSGNDLVEGGSGRDLVVGGRGNDVLYAGSIATAETDLDDDGEATYANGGDFLSGGDGDDSIVGNAEANLIEGGGGEDLIFAGAGDDWISGDGTALSRREQYQAALPHLDSFDLGVGDFLWGFSGAPAFSLETIVDEDESETIVRIAGAVVQPGLWSPPGGDADWIEAGSGDDTVFASGGDDVVFGGDGDDNIDAGTGADEVYAGNGDDSVFAGAGDDYLDGGDGNDTLSTLGGGTLLGGAGNDRLAAGGGSVLFDGGAGDDLLSGALTLEQTVRIRTGRGYGADFGASFAGTAIVEIVDGVSPHEVAITASEQGIPLATGEIFGSFAGIRIDIGEAGDSLFLMDVPAGFGTLERRIEFADGTVWDEAYIESLLSAPEEPAPVPAFSGTGDADLIYATAGADVLSGGEGGDWLVGDTGDDVYLYANGDGFDVIEDIDLAPGNSDILRFTDGVPAEDVAVYAQGDDYVLTVGDGGVRLREGRTQEGAIERVEFADGGFWSPADLEARAEILPDNRPPEMPASFGSVLADPGALVEIALPRDGISDPDRFDSVSLYAISADGEKLPDWLHFDATSLTLAGTPSEQDAGAHELLVVAADANGAAAVGSLTITVSGEVPAPEQPNPEQAPPQQAAPAAQEPIVQPASPAPAAQEIVAGDAPVLQGAAVPFRQDGVFSVATAAPLPAGEPSRIGDAADPAFRAIQHSTDALLQTGRTNLGDRYAEAIREFEERRLLREEAPSPPPPTDEEAEAWNAAMHSWHDRNPGFAESDLGGNDGTWSTGWGLPGPGESALGGTAMSSMQLGLANPNVLGRFQGAASAPALSEGFRDIR